MGMEAFLKDRPHVVVTDNGAPHAAAVYLDGRLFPVLGVGWELPPPRRRGLMATDLDGAEEEGPGIPIIKLAFYGRLKVLDSGEELPAELQELLLKPDAAWYQRRAEEWRAERDDARGLLEEIRTAVDMDAPFGDILDTIRDVLRRHRPQGAT